MPQRHQKTTEPELEIKGKLTEAKRLIDEALKLLAGPNKASGKTAAKASPEKATKAEKSG
jgi:hypothetical protein